VLEGSTLTAVNRGGEVHTFTEVEQFGGGIVPLLNDLSGNPTPAPECLALSPSDFVPPGAAFTVTESETGVKHYQCCIHAWMQTTVRVRGG
jgi:plastocyanin